MMAGAPEARGVFFYAKSDNGGVWEGDVGLCVDPVNRFRYRNAAEASYQCTRQFFRMENYRGDNYTTSLTQYAPGKSNW
jgi:hypothetical protein